MIDEKKIEEAAVKASITYSDGRYEDLGFQDGFKAGINWLLDNIKHDGEEVPKEKNQNVLMYYELYSVGEKECNFDEHYELCHTGEDGLNDNTWKIFCDEVGWCSKWLYIDDLLKGGK